jgi:hypothetical protein
MPVTYLHCVIRPFQGNNSSKLWRFPRDLPLMLRNLNLGTTLARVGQAVAPANNQSQDGGFVTRHPSFLQAYFPRILVRPSTWVRLACILSGSSTVRLRAPERMRRALRPAGTAARFAGGLRMSDGNTVIADERKIYHVKSLTFY